MKNKSKKRFKYIFLGLEREKIIFIIKNKINKKRMRFANIFHSLFEYFLLKL